MYTFLDCRRQKLVLLVIFAMDGGVNEPAGTSAFLVDNRSTEPTRFRTAIKLNAQKKEPKQQRPQRLHA